MSTGLTGIAALEAEMRDRLKAKDDEIDELRGALATQCGLTLAARSVLADLYEYAGSAWFDEAIATREEDELMARARTALRQTA